MRITIFLNALSGGGAERVACNLANFLAGRGHQVELMTMAEKAPAERLAESIVRTPLLRAEERGPAPIRNAKRVFRLIRRMRRRQADVYVVLLPVTTLLMLFLARLAGAPIIASERRDPASYPPLMQKALRRYAARASGYVFQTEEARRWYAPFLKGAESRVIPNAINPAFLRERYAGEREKTIVAVGRLTGQKNFPLLLRAFAQIAPAYPEHRLVIYGQGEGLESLQALSAALGIEVRVTFAGFVTDMPQRLERAGLFVLSSDYEGMPNALMEAMALGLPCVSTDCGGGGARFLIRDGENGLLTPVGDQGALAEAMRRLLADEALAARLGAEARRIRQALAPERIYGQWEAFLWHIAEKA